MASKTQLLSLSGVNVAYDTTHSPVLSNIDFSLVDGESVLFLGPSGCGKSTLAMVCANLVPSAVEAVVTGSVERHPALPRPGSIGYVFQDAEAQFCMLTVGDEAAFGLENASIAPDAMEGSIVKALRRVSLQVGLRAEHARFSGGMKQKLAIACALAMDPRLLIFDEPTANLDPASSRQVFEEIRKLHEANQTMIVIEHKFGPLLPYMDRIVLFDACGHIYRSGPPMGVLEEEWDWLVATGIVAPWQPRPEQGRYKARASNVSPRLEAAARSSGSWTAASSSSNPPALKMTNGCLKYGKRQDRHEIWNHVNFEVPAGSWLAVVGPNGSGKSSLLAVLMGLEKLTSGSLEMEGQPIQSISRRRRVETAAYCFQNPEFQFIYERVSDELANRVLGTDIPPGTLRLLDEFELSQCAKQSPFALSQGQKRRLSVASMLRENHDMYLLDEPTFGQDAHTQEVIMNRMNALHREGKTIVMATHDMALVQQYATHVAVLHDGGLAYFGSPENLFNNPSLLMRAHLLDDMTMDAKLAQPIDEPEARIWTGDVRRSSGWIQKFNPGYHLVAVIASMLVAMLANTLTQAFAMWLLPLFLMITLGRLSPLRIAKWLSPFVTFYVLYVFSFTAYGSVSPHDAVVSFLWFHLSRHGFLNGLTLACRMLSAVSFGILFMASTDLTDLVVSLCKNFRLSPRFAYGALAGIRFAPLFQAEWEKLRHARQLRGKDAPFGWLRPATYALPLLIQAVRMSERVAVAMEARGFFGAAAKTSQGRTFYRRVSVHWWDLAFAPAIVLLSTVLLLIS